MESGKAGKSNTANYWMWMVPILWTLFIVSLLILKYAGKGHKALYFTLVLNPFLIFLFMLFWALNLRRQKGVFKPVSVGFVVNGLAVMYVLMAFLFTPSYIASIRLGDKLIMGDNTCIKDTEYGRLAYFGLVTASTLGYGDIVPTIESGRIQFLVCLQVIEFWMFFLLAFSIAGYRVMAERELA